MLGEDLEEGEEGMGIVVLEVVLEEGIRVEEELEVVMQEEGEAHLIQVQIK